MPLFQTLQKIGSMSLGRGFSTAQFSAGSAQQSGHIQTHATQLSFDPATGRYSASSSTSSFSSTSSRRGFGADDDYDYTVGGSRYNNYEDNNGVTRSESGGDGLTQLEPGTVFASWTPSRRRSSWFDSDHSDGIPERRLMGDYSIRPRAASGRGWMPWQLLSSMFTDDF